jgi:cold shock CspA family protein
MSSSTSSTSQTAIQGERALARVKWFNSKSGFGFLTVTNGEHNGRDIFVHHSAIGVLSQQYKYLVEGEYVELFVLPLQSGEHEFQATNVCGVNGGKLMCETRNENRVHRTSYKSTSSNEPEKKKDLTKSVTRGAGGRGGSGRGAGRSGRGGRGAGATITK